jgi:hypothetical protein
LRPGNHVLDESLQLRHVHQIVLDHKDNVCEVSRKAAVELA